MTDRTERKDEKGLSARYLILVFVLGVAACAVFFSLGFLVGYTERSPVAAKATEEVSPSGAVPPVVNPPLEPQQAAQPSASTSTSAELPTEHLAPPPPSKAEPQRKAKPAASKVKTSEKPPTPKPTRPAASA